MVWVTAAWLVGGSVKGLKGQLVHWVRRCSGCAQNSTHFSFKNYRLSSLAQLIQVRSKVKMMDKHNTLSVKGLKGLVHWVRRRTGREAQDFKPREHNSSVNSGAVSALQYGFFYEFVRQTNDICL